MDDEERRAYYETPPPTQRPWDADAWLVIFINAPWLLLIGWGLVVAAQFIIRRVTHFVVTAIVPHWLAILMWLAIVALSVGIILVLIYLLTPPVRRMRVRLYYWRLGADLRRRSKETERQLIHIFEDAKDRANDIVARHTPASSRRN
jgi:CBS domain containing-hemolysin-like protein